jgi:hypothetical protein
MLTNNDSLAILAVDGNNKNIILHSFKNFGGTLLNPTNKYGCLSESGRVALTIIVNKRSLLVHLDLTMPAYVNIIGCLDQEETRALAVPIQDNSSPNNFRCSSSFLLAPWVFETILKANFDNPTTLIIASNDRDNDFDCQFENNAAYSTAADKQHEQMTKWLWVAQASLIPQTRYSIKSNNNALLRYYKLLHNQHITWNNPFIAPPIDYFFNQ